MNKKLVMERTFYITCSHNNDLLQKANKKFRRHNRFNALNYTKSDKKQFLDSISQFPKTGHETGPLDYLNIDSPAPTLTNRITPLDSSVSERVEIMNRKIQQPNSSLTIAGTGNTGKKKE